MRSKQEEIDNRLSLGEMVVEVEVEVV